MMDELARRQDRRPRGADAGIVNFAAQRGRIWTPTRLRAMQAPIKERYKSDPKAAVITLKAKGTLDDSNIACKVETGRALAVAGLHPATGGSGLELCSGDMLLEALVACAGVTVKAVATALEIPLRVRQRCRPKAISIFAARSASPRMRRSASRRSGCASISTPMRPGQARSAAQAHRALLRGLPDHQERPAGGCETGAGIAPCHARRHVPAISLRRAVAARLVGIAGTKPGDDNGQQCPPNFISSSPSS